MTQAKHVGNYPALAARDAYETWHEQLGIDIECKEPWHTLVKTHLDAGHDLTGKRILEIGCGRGGFACWLSLQPAQPFSITAADFSSMAVRKAQAFAAERGITVKWEVMDIQRIAQPDSTFDTVISCETVEHIPDPFQAVRELARVLKPGGRLFLSTPNYLGSMGLYRAYKRLRGRRYTEVGQPINNFTVLPRTWLWIKRVGLRFKCIDAIGHYLPFPGRPPIEFPICNNPRTLMRWFALHSLIVAEKP
jgi:SAM-dependent methyltransferase